jgi:hypothetical protein
MAVNGTIIVICNRQCLERDHTQSSPAFVNTNYITNNSSQLHIFVLPAAPPSIYLIFYQNAPPLHLSVCFYHHSPPPNLFYLPTDPSIFFYQMHHWSSIFFLPAETPGIYFYHNLAEDTPWHICSFTSNHPSKFVSPEGPLTYFFYHQMPHPPAYYF